MERWMGKVALVTGASVGIGASISKALVRHGLIVVGCARNAENLQKLSLELKGPGSFHPIQCDVSKEDQIVNMFRRIKEEHGRLDVCVNNAGLAQDAPILSGSYEQWRSMLDVNVLGLAICTQEAVKLMNEKDVKDGHIVNISSMSGHRITNDKDSHFYTATKFAVTALTEGTRNELAKMKSKIRITQLSPGVVQTEFFPRKSGEEKARKLYNSYKCLEAVDIADAVVFALSAPQHVQIHDMKIRPTEQIS